MFKIFNGWSKTPKDESVLFAKVNHVYNVFIRNYYLHIYFVTITLIVLCAVYYYLHWRKEMNLRRRLQEMQRTIERLPQRRRPGAAFRDHEIFRNAMRTVHKYTHSKDAADGAKRKMVTLKRTRSGTLYGCLVDKADNSNEKNQQISNNTQQIAS